MEVDESGSLAHLADQRVPASAGTAAFHDHHDASLDSAYEDNFECGEEAIQRQLLITQILSSPLLFCASTSGAAGCSKVEHPADGAVPIAKLGAQSEIVVGRSLTGRNARRAERRLGTLSELSEGGSRMVDLLQCDRDGSVIAASILDEVGDVLSRVIDTVEILENQRLRFCDNDSDECSTSELGLSWNRRPMSGRSASLDSGVSSVDDSRLSLSSHSEYAASPATTAGTTDSSDEAQVQEKTARRRSSRLEAEQPPLKVLVVPSTAKFPATNNSSSKSINTALVNDGVNERKRSCRRDDPLNLFVKPTAQAAIAVKKTAICRWQNCKFSATKVNDLADHITDAHVSTQGDKKSFVCLWEHCKVFNIPSTLKHWLEQHVVKHSRSKPLKCIVDGCLQRFSTKPLLEAHVNSHFDKNCKLKPEASLKSQQQLMKLAKRKRLLRQNSKMQAGRKYDFFDACIMHQIKESFLHFAEMEDPSTAQCPSASQGAPTVLASPPIIDRPCTGRRSGRRKFALTNEQQHPPQHLDVPSPDSGYNSTHEGDSRPTSVSDVESMPRACRMSGTGKKQILISYYRPTASGESDDVSAICDKSST